MNGEIGTLSQNGQIGGFYNWEIDIALGSMRCEDWDAYRLLKWKATANKYWLLEKPQGETFTARYYKLIKEKLVLINEVQVDIQIPNSNLNHIHNLPLLMTWTKQ